MRVCQSHTSCQTLASRYRGQPPIVAASTRHHVSVLVMTWVRYASDVGSLPHGYGFANKGTSVRYPRKVGSLPKEHGFATQGRWVRYPRGMGSLPKRDGFVNKVTWVCIPMRWVRLGIALGSPSQHDHDVGTSGSVHERDRSHPRTRSSTNKIDPTYEQDRPDLRTRSTPPANKIHSPRCKVPLGWSTASTA